MCYICRSKNKEAILKQLTYELEYAPKIFHLWNTTSVNHLIISISNNDGCHNQKLSVKILEKFLKWYKNNRTDKYLPKYGIERMYSKKCVQNLLKITEESTLISKIDINILFNKELNLDKYRKPSDYFIINTSNIFFGIGVIVGIFAFIGCISTII